MQRSILSFAAACVALLASTAAASAQSPLAAIPVGSVVTYHLTSQSTTESGPQSASHYVRFQRTTPTTIGVTLDGAPAGSITVGGDGSVDFPTALKPVLVPFGEIATLMRGAPKPLAQGAGWSANLPVPIEGTPDNVPMQMQVRQLGAGGATIAGTGSDSTDVQPGVRKFPTNVTVTTNFAFSALHTLTSASSNASIVVHVGRFGRDKHYGSSWTIVRQ